MNTTLARCGCPVIAIGSPNSDERRKQQSMTCGKDLCNLFAAVLANPEEDTPRLAYADELDALATGENDYAAKAELIRVQIELAKWPESPRPSHGTMSVEQAKAVMEWSRDVLPHRGPLLLRSHELEMQNQQWSRLKCPARGDGSCDICGGIGDLLWNKPWRQRLPRNPIFRRGFLDSVSCTLSEVGSEYDVEDAGPSQNWPRRFVPSLWSVAVLKACPTITRLVVADRRPFKSNGQFWWFDVAMNVETPTDLAPESDLPTWLFREMSKDNTVTGYPTESAARDALAIAACRVVRRTM